MTFHHVFIYLFILSLHFVPSLQSTVCILYLVCILYPVCSLQSAVCSLHFVLTVCKIYSGLAHDERRTLKSCVLVDEFDRILTSKAALDHIFQTCPHLIQYLKSYVITAPGDSLAFTCKGLQEKTSCLQL